MEVIECFTCKRMFRDTDGTGVCPLGHENGDWLYRQDDEDNEDDEYPVSSVVG